MKKLSSFLLIGIFLTSSCSTTAVWDSSLPPGETTTLYFTDVLIKEYNGITVNWKPAILGGLEIIIPAGESEFLADISSHFYTAQDQVFSQTFEAGKRYTLHAGHNRAMGRIGMTITDENGEVRFTVFRRR